MKPNSRSEVSSDPEAPTENMPAGKVKGERKKRRKQEHVIVAAVIISLLLLSIGILVGVLVPRKSHIPRCTELYTYTGGGLEAAMFVGPDRRGVAYPTGTKRGSNVHRLDAIPFQTSQFSDMTENDAAYGTTVWQEPNTTMVCRY